MLGLIGPLSLGEIVLISIVAVLVFGRRLPQVAGQAFRQVARLRRQLDEFRRESGIDREFRDVQDSLRDITHRPTLDPTLRDRAEPAPEEPPAADAEATEASEEDEDRPAGAVS